VGNRKTRRGGGIGNSWLGISGKEKNHEQQIQHDMKSDVEFISAEGGKVDTHPGGVGGARGWGGGGGGGGWVEATE